MDGKWTIKIKFQQRQKVYYNFFVRFTCTWNMILMLIFMCLINYKRAG